MQITDHDFGGYVTRHNVKCKDGRVITTEAFKECDGITVPLVWHHQHDEPSNVLGHTLLEHRPDGVYGYSYFNDSEGGKEAKVLISHKDITALSIYANELIEKNKFVAHGVIREVSLVLAGSNPGAIIDYVSVVHSDGSMTEFDDEAIIYSDSNIDIPEKKDELSHADDDKDSASDDEETIGDVFETLNEKQKTAVYAIIGQVLDKGGLEQSALSNSEEGEPKKIMKRNVFDGSSVEDQRTRPVLSHSDFQAIMETAKKVGSVKAAFLAHQAGVDFLEHAGTYGIDNISYLFPDAQNVTKEPTFITRKMEWVSVVMGGVNSSPFSRIKTLHADLTPDEARARGYVTGNLKVEQVFEILRRITTPVTVYKKQKLDRDDIIDITDFSVVSWMKREMRFMLDEELARAFLVTDGRDPVVQVDDKIVETNVRSIWKDDELYTYHKQVASTRTTLELLDDFITAMGEYRGSGDPDMFCSPSFLTTLLLLRDLDGRRLYRSLQELAAELGVNRIVKVPVMEGLSRGAPVYNLKAIAVNLRDYTVGADKGGEINFFEDFDIDYNQNKYLIETRISAALTLPKSAIVLEQAAV